ncbi:uncharacterized protein LOC134723525 [Mytilus trossulus]|uniref:uncharacterized protein LOC134723525 n=1 Tax=Mytilus trossulus TaxID=6551 RepID=UPI0030067432
MGREADRLSIISMKFNASGRKGRQFQEYRNSYLNDVVGQNQPDLLFLPGDKPDMSSPVLTDYRQAQVVHNQDTVLLYDTKRLQLQTQNSHELISSLVVPGITQGKLLYPLVNILAPKPTQHIVKQFHCISWHWELTQTTSQELYTFASRYLWLAQYLGWITGVEILIGGDFNLKLPQVQQLVDEHNQIVQNSIENVKPFFREMGFLDDMTDYVHRPGRLLRQLKLHQCKSVAGINQETDYFVASKEMQLCKTEMMTTSTLPGRCTTLTLTKPSTQNYCPLPTKTEMCIPSRPPRHNGG